MNKQDLIRLAIALGILSLVFLGVHLIGSHYNPRDKYSHPATRPGASWKEP